MGLVVSGDVSKPIIKGFEEAFDRYMSEIDAYKNRKTKACDHCCQELRIESLLEELKELRVRSATLNHLLAKG